MKPVNSIVIGDVGSGKTAVAISLGVLYLAGKKDSVVSLMAPTELLAEQHYKNLVAYTGVLQVALRPHTALITSKQRIVDGESVSKKELEKLLSIIRPLFCVGTHALLTKELNVSLAMVDEQHRFGVLQRSQNTSSVQPHYISFSATPIPRSLALTLYKHLDVELLEKLTTRNPITTTFVPIKNTEIVLQILSRHLQAKGKVYMLVPAVESEEESDIYTLAMAKKLVEKVVDEEQCVITHGKHATKTKELEKFKSDPHIKVCIATSVIEVGVDVPEATCIIILNAERFGLATLHQLRGRVGRNTRDDNECVIAAPYMNERLRTFQQLQDGFVLAEKDMELRGSGSLMGAQQSGVDEMVERYTQLSSEEQQKVVQASEEVDWNNPSYIRLKRFLEKQYSTTWKE